MGHDERKTEERVQTEERVGQSIPLAFSFSVKE